MEAALFTCSICGEKSRDICTFCTKDACVNHMCDRCKRCSDCCECEVPLTKRESKTQSSIAESPKSEFIANGSGNHNYN